MKWARTTLALAFLGSVAWAGDVDAGRREEIIKNMLTAMGKVTKTLSTIQDEESARASNGELKKTAEEWRLLRKKAENVPPPSMKEKERLAMLYKGKLEESQKLLFTQILRVQQVPGGKDALGDLAKAFASDQKNPPPK